MNCIRKNKEKFSNEVGCIKYKLEKLTRLMAYCLPEEELITSKGGGRRSILFAAVSSSLFLPSLENNSNISSFMVSRGAICIKIFLRGKSSPLHAMYRISCVVLGLSSMSSKFTDSFAIRE